jgi:hypothetical protein
MMITVKKMIWLWVDTHAAKKGETVARGDLAHVAGFMHAFSCGNRAACLAFLRSGKTYTAAPFIALREGGTS